VREVIAKGRSTFYKNHTGSVNQSQILKVVRSGELFGICQVDISVPEQWSHEFKGKSHMSPVEYFSEMSTLFWNAEVLFEAFGEHIQAHVEKYDLSKKPRRLLVGGIKAQKIIIATPILKWYIEHRMSVTKVHEVV
jgi:hypothetical protein